METLVELLFLRVWHVKQLNTRIPDTARQETTNKAHQCHDVLLLSLSSIFISSPSSFSPFGHMQVHANIETPLSQFNKVDANFGSLAKSVFEVESSAKVKAKALLQH